MNIIVTLDWLVMNDSPCVCDVPDKNNVSTAIQLPTRAGQVLEHVVWMNLSPKTPTSQHQC
jgi:hypothetical protein